MTTNPRHERIRGPARFETFLGFRYIWSRSGNGFVSFISIISMLGIAVGVAVLVVVLSVVNGFETELRSRILSMTSHAAISGYESGLAEWEEASAKALQNPSVLATAPFVEGEGMLVNGDLISGVGIRGVLPDEELMVSGIGDKMTAGRLTALRPGEFGIVLGAALADELDSKIGDRVILAINQGTITPAGIMPRLRRFSVVGIFEAGMYEYDRGIAFIHLDDALRLYRLGEEVSGLRLRIEDLFQAPAVVREVAGALGGNFYVTDWTRQHRNFFRSIALSKRMLFTVLLLVVAVAAFNIVSTLVMVVKDKQSDIAILRTLGASPRSIMAVFTLQGTLIGVLGILAGVALGVAIGVNTETLVHALEALLDTRFLAPDVYFISDLPSEIRLGDVMTVCVTAVILCVLSTIYPAWRAARTQPAEALRYE
ncbi:MAG: lipoprotein-releasing ABC transporter permease subunit [Gammaproteobacteria bacterium]|nr:MAG: lipoprotein-releasing ABC transporter permease subunit [Gammaproteobacteria bacterium]